MIIGGNEFLEVMKEEYVPYSIPYLFSLNIMRKRKRVGRKEIRGK